eukprot:g13006.t1
MDRLYQERFGKTQDTVLEISSAPEVLRSQLQRLYTAERDALMAAQLEREQLAGKVQQELTELENQIQEALQHNAKLQEELPFVRQELASKLRDKEEAKKLTEKAHQLVETL